MTARLSHIDISGGGEFAPPPEIEQEQRVAIFDLLEENRFALRDGPEGPYRLTLSSEGSKLRFLLASEAGAEAGSFAVALGPLRQVIKDYGQICRSYYQAVRTQSPAEIEALDEARRAIHVEGGRQLQERLSDRAEMDDDTSRRLFTLLCAMTPGD